MAIQKNANLDISVAAEQNPNYNAKPSVQFSTQDRNTAKYTFAVKQNNKAVDLTDVTATVTLYMADKSVFQNNATVTNAEKGEIEYTIPPDAIRHHGSAKGELKLTYANGDALGGLRFSFTIEQSLIDKADGVLKEVYIEDFQAISDAVAKKAETVTTNLEKLNEEYQNKAYTVDEKLADVQATVNDLRENGTGIDAQARQEVEQVSARLSDTQNNLAVRGINIMFPPTPLVGAKGDNKTDDSVTIQNLINYCASNNLQPYFPKKTYRLSKTITIPDKCKVIDFNFASFNYVGDNGTFCLSGGSTNGADGGFSGGVLKNLFINGTGAKVVNGVDARMIRECYFSNISIYNVNIGISLSNSYSNTFDFCKIFTAKVGVDTGLNANALTFRTLSLSFCELGVRLGADDSQGCYGIVFNDECQFQSCGTVFELNCVQQASIINSYFEANDLLFKINTSISSENGIYRFSIENCLIDMGLDTRRNLCQNWDTSGRQINMKFTGNRFTGRLIGTFFEKGGNATGYGNWISLIFKNNHTASSVTLLKIFPLTFRFGRVETDMPLIPTINSEVWDVHQSIQIHCLGNETFSITGAVKRKAGVSGDTFITGLPYYFTHETSPFYFSVVQYMAGGTEKKARIKVNNLQNIDITTVDNTDTNPIVLTGVRWCTRV